MKNLFIITLFLISTHSMAFKLMPMSISINSSQKDKTALFTVFNDSDEPIAIQLDMRKRLMKPDGSEEHPEVDDFLVYPDQLVLGAKKRRVIKVRWLKGEVKDIERSYRLIAEQLPIDVSKKKDKKTDIKILLRYVAALYVAPKTSSAKLRVISAKTTKDLNRIIFHVENSGNKHHVLLSPKVNIIQEGKTFSLTNLEGIRGENILAKTKRYFSFIPPKGVNIQKPYQVELLIDE
ncbi:p pilus assembly protein, chaperone papd. p pilus assembly protein, chaperone papd [Halobacteriovorax marinus SJ]|uniref:Pilus assembly protein n=1 Tax=Halobacteriovorax marinus (strain ATCC BAA-682 / DSM 15412 / SJ) TaxID=862908 RepID=E1X0V6_HALMS|nr:fimbria/pilus periplasmic chaperone [Halobacteriovorax marinus]CBW26445.1 p pilus assembly protein, chaperone papd. p pilus assembly protein, chaperone papd [Halobacteriovorax marinus SJ]